MQLQPKWARLLRTLAALTLTYVTVGRAQQFPDNTCGQYFQYVNDGGGTWHGELTLLQLALGRSQLEVRFSQRGVQDQAVVGSLLPHPDEATMLASVGRQRLVKFRVSLWPDATGLLPKLTSFTLNGAALCTGSAYVGQSSYFNRFYVIVKNNVASQGRRFEQSPPPFNSFADQQSDVAVKTLIYKTDSVGSVAFPNTNVPTFRPSSPVSPLPQSPGSIPPPWMSWTPARPWTPPTSTTAVMTTVPSRNPEVNRFSPTHTTRPALPVICGREGTLTPFIHNGRSFARGKYPWLAAIYHKESLTLAFKCGGSLMSNRMVITAAHCVYKMKEDRIHVSVGRYDLDNYDEDGAEAREVMHILSHPDFSTHILPDADIALLTLSRPVTFNELISPICLWEEPGSSVIANEIGTIAGWGTDEQGNSMTRFPRVVEAEIATEADCVRTWKAQKITSNRTLCAGNLDGSGPCLGDSGGGLMMKRNSRWLLRGIVSLGERGEMGQCNLGQYVLYCDLSKHLDWISSNLV